MMRKWRYAATVIVLLLANGCGSETGGAGSSSPSAAAAPSQAPAPVTASASNQSSTPPSNPAQAGTTPAPSTTDKNGLQLASISNASGDKTLTVYRASGPPASILALTTGNDGKTANRATLPLQQDWETSVDAQGVFASLPPVSNVEWILLTSGPALGLMGKMLYQTKDDGKSWAFVKDVSSIVEGYVTGVSFRDATTGWITATYHGGAAVPLYRTTDGGKSWSLQKLDVPSSYQYGDAYPPDFDEQDASKGTLRIKFVGGDHVNTMEFHTTDGGKTWTGETG